MNINARFMILFEFLSTSIELIRRQVPVSILLFVLVVVPGFAQDRAKQSSPYDPRDAVGLYHDYAPFGHQMLAIMMSNLVAEPLDIPSTRTERAMMFALGGGLRRDSTGQRSLVWKGTLLDFDRSSAEPTMRWTVNGDVFEHLRPRGFRLNPFYTVGMTVVDYDRTTVVDLDARWMQGRLGGGTEIMFGENLSVIPDVRAGIGLTSITPGNATFALPGIGADSTISGMELVGRGRLTGRLAMDFYKQLLVSAEISYRNIGADKTLRLILLEGSLKYVHTMQYPFERLGFEVDFAVRRQQVRSGDAVQAITSYHTAIQFEL